MQSTDLAGIRVPVATCRLQLNRDFGFAAAAEIVPYLHRLGITDIYSSPFFRAREGSMHGYDIIDHNSLNPELGTEGDFAAFTAALRAHGMGLILDIVPNHMCVESRGNDWWMDVMENGPSSPYASFFDIDWQPVKRELDNKVLIPILGDQYGTILENGELSLVFRDGAFYLTYYDHRLPIIPKTYVHILSCKLEELKGELGADDPCYQELLSIMTALQHLPFYTEQSPEKVVERYREKEIVKRRLSVLCEECSAIREFIARNVALFNGERGNPASFDLLDKLLREQVYRISHWRVATEEINYRRFFDINNLGAIRMENPDVFNAAHRLLFDLVRDGIVTGLRIDHADGLYDPSEYLRKLQEECFARLALRTLDPQPEEEEAVVARVREDYRKIVAADPQYRAFLLVVEKILLKGERLPEEWPVFSSTGYVFANLVNGLFVDTRNAKTFDSLYHRFIGTPLNFQELAYDKKKLVMQVSMSSEINTLGHHLNTISELNRHTRDFTLNSLIKAIVEVIAFFPVYRTYIAAFEVSERDRQYIDYAVAKAKRKNPAMDASIFEFIRSVLLQRSEEGMTDQDRLSRLDFAMRFQQITGPVMAKGIEDTAFYLYNRLVSLNDVGGSPERFGIPLEAFHGHNIERNKARPHAMLATSTHDSKRSEDVRARINVLSEIPETWRDCLARWSRMNRKRKMIVDGQAVPDRNEEYFLYQTLVGSWPLCEPHQEEFDQFRQRIREYMLKSVREAKINSSWINVNTLYEEALDLFICAILDTGKDNQFVADFHAFQQRICRYGLLNALSQTLLKMTVPGYPDFYRGTELWDFSLVDPDNRRPVDFTRRKETLNGLVAAETEQGTSFLAAQLAASLSDGRIKLYVIWKTLNFRRNNPLLFQAGRYLSLDAMGERADCVCAFERSSGNREVIVVAPRFFTHLTNEHRTLPLGAECWNDTRIRLPFEPESCRFRNIFTGATVAAVREDDVTVLRLSDVLSEFPVALLEKEIL